jgi:hypothetical protein
MKFEDILITPNQYLGGNRQAKRYLANPAATAFQTGNMLYNAAGAGYSVDAGFNVDADSAQEIYDETVNNPGPIRARDPNDLTVQDPDSSNSNGSSGSNGNQDSGGSNGNGSGGSNGSPGGQSGQTVQNRAPAQGNPVTSNPRPDPADQQKPEQDTGNGKDKDKSGQAGQDQEQKKDSSELLYWAIPAATLAIGIGIYLYGNS